MLRARLERFRFAEIISIVGGVVFFLQALLFSYTEPSIMDEGVYLFGGSLFARGIYDPYQDYGPWTNHMPLAFFIPGLVQVIFGFGLRQGRYFAILLGLLFVLGMWIVARRLGGRWWAAGSVWAVATNPYLIKIDSLALSEGLAACILVWALVLALGRDRSQGQVLAGAALAGIAGVTRLNVLPVLPVLAIYFLRDHGRRRGLAASALMAVPFVVVHAAYWPEILKFWVGWLPEQLFPFLDMWRGPNPWNTIVDGSNRLLGSIKSLATGIRLYLASFASVGVAITLWPRRDRWEDWKERRAGEFLLLAFLVLLAANLWASFGREYCAWCFSTYTGFYYFLGILCLVAVAQAPKSTLTLGRIGLGVGIILVLAMFFGYADIEGIGHDIASKRIGLGGDAMVGDLLQAQFGLEASDARSVLTMVVWSAGGLLSVLVFLLSALFIAKKRPLKMAAYATSGAVVVFVLASALQILSLTNADYGLSRCSGDILALHEDAGETLRNAIPEGSLVYWEGSSHVLLLYPLEVRINPAQLHLGYTYLAEGHGYESLERFGFWDADLGETWIREADILVLADGHERTESGNATLIAEIPSTNPCRPELSLSVFKNN